MEMLAARISDIKFEGRNTANDVKDNATIRLNIDHTFALIFRVGIRGFFRANPKQDMPVSLQFSKLVRFTKVDTVLFAEIGKINTISQTKFVKLNTVPDGTCPVPKMCHSPP